VEYDTVAEHSGKNTLLAKLTQVFTPGAPVDTLDLFSGRIDQAFDVMAAINQRGQHVAMYGERGVGKTSLANVIPIVAQARKVPLRAVAVNCTTGDDFSAIWRNVFRGLGNGAPDTWTSISPEDVRFRLEDLDGRTLIVIDEVDRLEDDQALTLLADTVKTLSDHSVNVTLLLVGVADSVEDLIGDHASIERAVTQVLMPRMSAKELAEIADKGMKQLGMGIAEDAKKRIARLSEGLPHFTHLLGLYATQRAIMDERNEVDDSDIEPAIGLAVQKIQHTIRTAYQKATRSPRSDSLYEHVLTACALAQKDDLGYFTAGSVRAPMSEIMGKPYGIPAFARHLSEFTTDDRGPALRRSGQRRKYFYRFENPMLQPFAILRALSKSLMTESQVLKLQADEFTAGGWLPR
jgi:hypothetical protein